MRYFLLLIVLINFDAYAFDYGNTYLADVNAQAASKKDWFAGHKPPTALGEVEPGSKVPKNLRVYLEANTFLVNNAELDAYLTGVKNNLLSAWQGDVPKITVLVESKGYEDLKADVYDQIVFSTELLKNIDSEDRLAGLMAHEIAHILLNHNQSKKIYADLVPTFLEASGFAAIYQKSRELEKSKKAMSDRRMNEMMLSANAVGWIWSDLVSPAWDRGHEAEADKLGLDLMIKAGYNPREFTRALQDLALITEHKTERLEYLKSVAVDKVVASIPETRTNSTFDSLISGYEYKYKKSAVEATFNKMAIFSISHDPADVREQKVKAYMSDAYADFFEIRKTRDADLKKVLGGTSAKGLFESEKLAFDAQMAVDEKALNVADQKSAAALKFNGGNDVYTRYIRYFVRDQQGFPAKAQENLEFLSDNILSPKFVYLELAKRQLLEAKPERAEQLLLAATGKFGEVADFYPLLVASAVARADNDLANDYVQQCKTQENVKEKLKNMFKKSRGSEVDSVYERCLAALGSNQGDALAKQDASTDKVVKKDRKDQKEKEPSKVDEALSDVKNVLDLF